MDAAFPKTKSAFPMSLVPTSACPMSMFLKLMSCYTFECSPISQSICIHDHATKRSDTGEEKKTICPDPCLSGRNYCAASSCLANNQHGWRGFACGSVARCGVVDAPRCLYPEGHATSLTFSLFAGQLSPLPLCRHDNLTYVLSFVIMSLIVCETRNWLYEVNRPVQVHQRASGQALSPRLATWYARCRAPSHRNHNCKHFQSDH